METAAFNPAHINIALVHKGFDEKSERLAAAKNWQSGPLAAIRHNVSATAREDWPVTQRALHVVPAHAV